MKKILGIIIGFFMVSTVGFCVEFVGEMRLEGEFLNGDLLRIGVEASEMGTPVLGTSFRVLYDEKVLKFLRYEPGEFLERGGDPFYLVKDEIGKVYFGETLRRDDKFPVGEGRIVDLYFQIIEEAEFEFLFENGVVSTIETIRQDLDPILWDDLVITRVENNFELPERNSLNFNYTKIISWGMAVLGFGASIFAYFFIKNRPSVNFK